MTTDLLDLARAVVASPHWRWCEGMVDTEGWRCVDVSGECATMVGPRTWSDPERPAVCHAFWRGEDAHGGDVGAWEPRRMLPDLEDPGTLGCLLALYEEARPVRRCPNPVYTSAAVYGLSHQRTVTVLVAALLSASKEVGDVNVG